MRIIENTKIALDTYKMVLQPTGLESVKLKALVPGQFINIKIEGFYLRRPISIADWNDESLTIIYKVVGKGTKTLSKMEIGIELDILWPLGNGYNLTWIPYSAILIGGGVGVPPMYGLAKKLVEVGKKPRIILGFRERNQVFYDEEFRKLGLEVTVYTEDGSYGEKGFVTDGFHQAEYVCACGPERMLEAIYSKAQDGQYSFEARMACGFGGCMGCSCETLVGNKRICKEGPVLLHKELLWK